MTHRKTLSLALAVIAGMSASAALAQKEEVVGANLQHVSAIVDHLLGM